jgi:hypothetical protein
MNRTVRITCPKEFNKKYMSRQYDNYINKLDVYHNAQKIFDNIDDAEENLPIILEKSIVFDNINVFEFNYDIKFHSVEEQAKIIWSLKPHHFYLYQSHVQLIRLNSVQGSEHVSDDYCITVKCNQHTHSVGKEYHQGQHQNINFEDLIDANGYCCFSVETKKVFDNTSAITYDQLQFEIL